MPSQPAATEVLVVGAGPVGLTLACELAWRGVRVRIIDSKPRPSEHSKAIGVFPRTLELLENQGVAAEMVKQGTPLEGVLIHAGRRRIARIDARLIDSHYNFILTLEQSTTEKILIDRLAALGVQVERPVRLVTFHQGPEAVAVSLEGDKGEGETCRALWVVGCDGAHSTVRKALGLPFEGEPFEEAFNLADVRMSLPLPEAADHILLFLSSQGPLFMAPLAGEGRYRLIMNEPPGSAKQRLEPALDDVRRWWGERVGYPPAQAVEIAHPTWLSRFTIHRRIVPTMRQGRVLLAGDAAHIHSPAGAQGMNTGIQDAINLAWKLGLVTKREASAHLLDSYSDERLPVARMVLKGTDLLTQAMTMRAPLLLALRNRVMGLALKQRWLQAKGVNIAAGLWVNYRQSALSGEDNGNGSRAGDRAPDLPIGHEGTRRLYDLLCHGGYTLMIFTGKRASAKEINAARDLAEASETAFGGLIQSVVVSNGPHPMTNASHWALDTKGEVHARYAVTAPGLVLVRPDRYLALRSDTLSLDAVHHYLSRLRGCVANEKVRHGHEEADRAGRRQEISGAWAPGPAP